MSGQVEGEVAPWKNCLGQAESTELDNALFFDYEFSVDQLMEIAGLCVAQVRPLQLCSCAIHDICFGVVSGTLLSVHCGVISCAVGMWTWE